MAYARSELGSFADLDVVLLPGVLGPPRPHLLVYHRLDCLDLRIQWRVVEESHSLLVGQSYPQGLPPRATAQWDAPYGTSPRCRSTQPHQQGHPRGHPVLASAQSALYTHLVLCAIWLEGPYLP